MINSLSAKIMSQQPHQELILALEIVVDDALLQVRLAGDGVRRGAVDA